MRMGDQTQNALIFARSLRSPSVTSYSSDGPYHLHHGNRQDRSDSLPACEQAIAHAFVQGRQRGDGGRRDEVEKSIDVDPFSFGILRDIHSLFP